MYFFFFSSRRRHTRSVSAFLLNRSSDLLFVNVFSHIETNSHITGSFKRLTFSINRPQPTRTRKSVLRVANCDGHRSEERFSRNAETDLVCRLLLENKKSARCRRCLLGRRQA